jgi:signal transduction histidine kinase
LGNSPNAPWPVAEALQGPRIQVVENLAGRFVRIPPGPWSDPPNSAVVVGIPSNNPREPAGFLILGVSARLKLDGFYKDFIELVKNQIATAITNARAYEEERKRAEALAELNRAKSAFFSNVSHEFRTPLTLMLGPLEDLLTKQQGSLSPKTKAQLELVNRNGLRLLRLVNTLLDFSRIEAGRAQAVFEPTDLAAFTTDLASVFRAATERAGLNLRVDCPPLPEPVYVDREMWEKIVLNLMSNAFKFTFEGGIEVSLRVVERRAELRVSDTGVGLPPEEMPRIFERFHRVHNTRSRTHEGTGIGLALVQELLKLHGGDVRAESEVGRGTTFIATVPLGGAHLPTERIGVPRTGTSTAVGAAPFLEEALRWLPDQLDVDEMLEPPAGAEPIPVRGDRSETKARPRIIVADDNADLRQYLARLLVENYEVQPVADGAAALAAARERPPDLILSDIMMPRLDGFGLVRELRADAALRTVPIILLSARAGEEARVDGLEHGADDYLVKPFSARELLARVAAHLNMSRMRKEFQTELERLVVARTKSLQETTEQLNDFCYSIAHDLKAPIRTQVSFANLVLEEFGKRLGPKGIDFVSRMRDAAQRQARLVNDLLSHMSLNRTELPLERLELAHSLEAVCSDLNAEAQSARAVVEMSAAKGLVMANSASLHLVLSNLLSNAIKFVRPGVRPQVTLWTERQTWDSGEAFVRLWAKDNGIGIPARAHAKIFGVFERLHPRDRYPGNGMGLAIVKKAIERMGGRVGVESHPGQGSRFWVELRAAELA